MGYRRFPFEGGTVEYVVEGPEDAPDLVVFHVGTPSAGVPFPDLAGAAARRGLRTAIYSRGGYGRSTRRPGRTVADEARITAALADRLGYARFVTAGYSGGGPVALACAALMPKRVRACMAIASLAPWAEVGDEFMHWVADPEDWAKLRKGDEVELAPDFEEVVTTFGAMTVERAVERYGKSPRDRAALLAPDGFGRPLAHAMRRALSRGFWGWLDDNVAEARDWGFRVRDIAVPVVVRHGELDPLVDVRQGRWLASAIPGARSTFIADAGHMAVVLPWEQLIDGLLDAAARA